MAVSDFKDANRMKSADTYLPLLLAIAKMHTGDTAIAVDMSDEVQKLSTSWPMPVMQFYLGKSSADELLSAARGGDASVQQNRLCEAHFYLG